MPAWLDALNRHLPLRYLTLIATAYDRLREHHYTLWLHDAGHDLHSGWITRSDDNEAMRMIASALGVDVRPGAA